MPGEIVNFTAEELEQLFADEVEGGAPTPNDGTAADNGQSTPDASKDVEQTKAFSRRLNEKISQERDAIAKRMGFETYDDMINSKNKQEEEMLIKQHGLNEKDLEPVISQLVEKRLSNDPRMKELEMLRAKKVEDFAKKELEEISNLTNGEITRLEQLPKEVIDLWSKKGSLKSAYIELEGEKLINKIKAGQSRGQTLHLQSPGGTPPSDDGLRPLTAEEKSVWKFFNPNMSDEELNNKRTKR